MLLTPVVPMLLVQCRHSLWQCTTVPVRSVIRPSSGFPLGRSPSVVYTWVLSYKLLLPDDKVTLGQL